MATLKMPYGKYRGKRIISVPTEYLHWMLKNNDELDAEMRRAVESELERRGESVEKEEDDKKEPAKEQPKKEKKTEQPAVEVKHVSPLGQRLSGDVRMLFRNLALKYHPDRGGSQDAMLALNDLHDQIQELLTRTFTS